MGNPLVSILMPVYNASLYLQEAIDSVLNQTFTDFEFIIIDDGSTDQSRYIIKKCQDARIRLISNRHNFIESLNIGILESKGKYIARMDADDIMLPNRLEIQFAYMEQHPEITVCGSSAERFGYSTGTMSVEEEHSRLISFMLVVNPMIHPTVIIRRSKLKKHLYVNDYLYAEDYKLWTDLAIQGAKFANIPDVLLRYRISTGQVTYTRSKEMYLSSQKIKLEYAEQVVEQILANEPAYFIFFNQLIKLLNDKLISKNSFLHNIYFVYQDHLLKNEAN